MIVLFSISLALVHFDRTSRVLIFSIAALIHFTVCVTARLCTLHKILILAIVHYTEKFTTLTARQAVCLIKTEVFMC